MTRRTKRRMPLPLWIVMVLLLIAVGVGPAVLGQQTDDTIPDAAAPAPAEAAPSPAPTGDAAPPAATGRTALEALTTVPVKGRAAKTGYDRDLFGPRWLDVDRNGCDTRNDILAAQLTDVVREGRCRVMSGTLADPFTGATIPFLRGQGTSERVQIDHVVALSDAWQKGAQALTPAQRAAFANDPLNLLAVDGAANAQKGDGDAATWLPRNRSFRCAYVARQVAVKAAYRLWVTAPERDAIARVLQSCPGEPVPVAG